jgi:hypothetical protein
VTPLKAVQTLRALPKTYTYNFFRMTREEILAGNPSDWRIFIEFDFVAH